MILVMYRNSTMDPVEWTRTFPEDELSERVAKEVQLTIDTYRNTPPRDIELKLRNKELAEARLHIEALNALVYHLKET